MVIAKVVELILVDIPEANIGITLAKIMPNPSTIVYSVWDEEARLQEFLPGGKLYVGSSFTTLSEDLKKWMENNINPTT